MKRSPHTEEQIITTFTFHERGVSVVKRGPACKSSGILKSTTVVILMQ